MQLNRPVADRGATFHFACLPCCRIRAMRSAMFVAYPRQIMLRCAHTTCSALPITALRAMLSWLSIPPKNQLILFPDIKLPLIRPLHASAWILLVFLSRYMVRRVPCELSASHLPVPFKRRLSLSVALVQLPDRPFPVFRHPHIMRFPALHACLSNLRRQPPMWAGRASTISKFSR